MKMDVFEVRFGCWKHLARYGAHVDSFGITILNLDPQHPEGPSATMVLKLGLSETAMEAEHDSLTFWNRMSLYTERCLDDPRCMMYGPPSHVCCNQFRQKHIESYRTLSGLQVRLGDDSAWADASSLRALPNRNCEHVL